MRELVLFLAQSLVDQPDQVVVTQTEGPEAIILELNVAPDDMGKVIGKQGRIAKAIRSVVKAATEKGGKPVFVEIGSVVETGATLGLLEVMKTFHRLHYRGEGLPARAVVRECLVGDGDDVERGQPVFRVEPA